jgi:hypothetical protein
MSNILIVLLVLLVLEIHTHNHVYYHSLYPKYNNTVLAMFLLTNKISLFLFHTVYCILWITRIHLNATISWADFLMNEENYEGRNSQFH